MGTVKSVVFLIIGSWLLITLPACETSKHVEIMSTEDLRAKAQKATAPETVTEIEQPVVPFEGKPIESAGLAEALVPIPEPPPIPAQEPEPEPAPPAPEPAPASPAPEPEPAPPAPAPPIPAPAPSAPPAPAPPAPEPEPAPPAPEPAPPAPAPKPAPPPPPPAPEPEPITEEPVPVEEPVAEPEPEIAKLEPDDFVPEPEPPAPAPAPEPVVDSGLADVFFDFDQYAIRADAVSVLERDAELLKGMYKDSSVLIEGHCDERGTVEYNLELGKRRAQAVKNYLIDLGIDESRIRIVSYGKERPFCTESEPDCWMQNRRGHFVRQ